MADTHINRKDIKLAGITYFDQMDVLGLVNVLCCHTSVAIMLVAMPTIITLNALRMKRMKNTNLNSIIMFYDPLNIPKFIT